MKTLSSIFILRTNKTFVRKYEKTGNGDRALLATAMKNFERIGYKFSPELYNLLKYAPSKVLIDWYKDSYPVLQESVGDHVTHRPMYPNFPEQVMEASEVEIYFNAFLHYLLNVYPNQDKDLRADYSEFDKLRTIEFAEKSEMYEFFQNKISSKSAFSPSDKEDVTAFFEQGAFYVPATFPNKENLSFVSALAFKHGDLHDIAPHYKTATDVLRLAVALSDGDVSLAETPKFRKFKRSERRLLLSLLEKAGNIEEDMLRFKSAWKRLGEVLHPGDYVNVFPNSYKAFTAIRNNEKIETFNSKVEKAFRDEDSKTLFTLLKSRPGDFARRLDHALRTFHSMDVLDAFNEVAVKVSPTVLLQVKGHFTNKSENPDLPKIIIPKGNTNTLQVLESKGFQIPKSTCDSVVQICDVSLENIFAEREKLGNVYVDPALKGVAIPFGLRNASESLETFGRGTRFKLDDKSTLRFFIHWKNVQGGYGTDIDLSAISYGENFNEIGHISYYNLRSGALGAHSGDITNAPNGASEFIDIDIDKALANGSRYVGMVVHSYSRDRFSDVPECFSGFMSREAVQSGEVYEPASVRGKADLTVEATQAIPYIFDLKTREAIWLDITMSSKYNSNNNLHSNLSNIELAIQSFVKNKPVSLYDLFTLHASSRGTLVDSPENADLTFGFDGDVSPRDTDKILSLYL